MAAHKEGAQTRALAALALDQVLSGGRNLDTALAATCPPDLSDRDRAFVAALCFGTLRTHLRNDLIVGRLLERPLRARDSVVAALLSVGLHALIDADTPAYAAVSATVDATAQLGKPKLRGLVNAVLRRFLRESESLLAACAAVPEARWQHPQWLIDSVRADWPADWEEILAASNRQAPMWLRINLARSDRAAWLATLLATGAQGSPSDDLPAAVLLDAAVPVQELPGFAVGACSVQDAASQLAAPLLDVAGMRVLDACAAPGGKTGHLLEAGAAHVTALDSSPRRLERVRDNLQRLQLEAEIIAGDALTPADWWDGRLFDRILLDAPCSATGVIRRHPDIRFLRRASDIAGLAATQLAMLQSVWAMLRPGGRLLYSTCSLLRAENDAVITEFLRTTADAEVVDTRGQVPESLATAVAHGVQLLPGRNNTDGFYYALIERRADANA